MSRSSVNVDDFGAIGDGLADDTAAVREAIASLTERGGAVCFPPGRYRIDTVAIPDFVTLRGEGGWSYREPGSTVIVPLRDEQPCLFTLHGNRGGRLVGLALDGENRGESMHGIMASKDRSLHAMEQNFVLDDLWVSHFTGSGVTLDRCHVWCVRHCNFQFLGRDGIDAAKSCDAWVIDNQIGHCGRFGLHVGSSTIVTANRIEQNGHAGVKFNAGYVENTVLTGNHFCSERGPAIDLSAEYDPPRLRGVTLTGNMMRNSARDVATDDTPRNCHIRLDGVRGVACNGNLLHVLRGSQTPAAGIVMRNCTECAITGNVLHFGAMDTLIRDLGGNTDCVIANNPGSLKNPADDDS